MSPQGINIPFALGELLLGVEAFFVRDWVDLQLLAHGPVLLLTSLAWVCPESVRWLLAKASAAQRGMSLLNSVGVGGFIEQTMNENHFCCAESQM